MTVAEVGIHSSGNGELNLFPLPLPDRPRMPANMTHLSKSFMKDDRKTVLKGVKGRKPGQESQIRTPSTTGTTCAYRIYLA